MNTKDHEIMRVAEKCGSYEISSNQISLDVDGEVSLDDWKDDDPELYKEAKKYFGHNE